VQRHPRDQRRLIFEVAIQRGAGNAELRADAAQRQALDTLEPDGPQRGVHERAFEIAVMVGALPFPLWFRRHLSPAYAKVLTTST
jgi:hypothetical protein